MKFREEIRTRLVDHTVDGITHQVEQTHKVRVPVLPRDWDAVAVRSATGLVLGLTTLAIVWSTYSIGQLLHGGIGYAAAAIFDIAWLVNVLLEWLSRFDASKRAFSRRLGWALLACTMGAIFWHGLLAGSVALGVVGAAVSMFAKVLWMDVMRFIDKDLSPEDAAWVRAEISKANAKLAIASVRRQVARVEQTAALELLAAEKSLGEVDEQQANTPEQQVEKRPLRVPLNSANTVPEQGLNMAELARQQLSASASNKDAFDEIMRRLPTANPESVQATVRREARRQTRYM
ncbi:MULTISPECIES: hypothetical protein [unclassified Streptomyces]|uniref:hypothetical protein n=1 Tax=unclassified Streptomyces TaxID=2593676 RepID=UPI003D92AAE1